MPIKKLLTSHLHPIDNDINGVVLLDMDLELLAEMGISEETGQSSVGCT